MEEGAGRWTVEGEGSPGIGFGFVDAARPARGSSVRGGMVVAAEPCWEEVAVRGMGDVERGIGRERWGLADGDLGLGVERSSTGWRRG